MCFLSEDVASKKSSYLIIVNTKIFFPGDLLNQQEICAINLTLKLFHAASCNLFESEVFCIFILNKADISLISLERSSNLRGYYKHVNADKSLCPLYFEDHIKRCYLA